MGNGGSTNGSPSGWPPTSSDDDDETTIIVDETTIIVIVCPSPSSFRTNHTNPTPG
ncbi:hypothetical protein SLEP1_g46897 [Rubroshorea leprosula]|uniref:Uncharacterized protein n=1 Tax=Rubroshorea leprosula TaxID=152421 RepID=A0AAV5LQK3_9ROSI|nr:hypothetical protein SLEP1_g46897 [Rubroshorea leprosula]